VPERFREGIRLEDLAGYSRAVTAGDRIVASGTADLAPDGTIRNPHDTYQQTIASERALAAVEALGGRLENVVRTRLYLAPEALWEDAARPHHDMLRSVAPANTTLYVAGFPAPGIVVEVELDAQREVHSTTSKAG
jgi:enamine deaminase RidA (YjgF/YER057c/UK114 family)